MKLTPIQRTALRILRDTPASDPNAGNGWWAVERAVREVHPERKHVPGYVCTRVRDTLVALGLMEKVPNSEQPTVRYLQRDKVSERGLAAISGLVLAALLLAGSACAPVAPCEPAYDLTMTGEAPPPDAALVLKVAQEHCDRPIVGGIEWRPGADKDEASGRPVQGMCYADGGGCPIRAWVAVPTAVVMCIPQPDGTCSQNPCLPGGEFYGSAICSAEAHEIGHWCLFPSTEDEAVEFARMVNTEAIRRMP
jgi:hypothetical protein